MVRTIRLTPDEVQSFVNVTSKCDFDIDIFYNRYVVDAKSFLGIFSLDLSGPLVLHAVTDDARAFDVFSRYQA